MSNLEALVSPLRISSLYESICFFILFPSPSKEYPQMAPSNCLVSACLVCKCFPLLLFLPLFFFFLPSFHSSLIIGAAFAEQHGQTTFYWHCGRRLFSGEVVLSSFSSLFIFLLASNQTSLALFHPGIPN